MLDGGSACERVLHPTLDCNDLASWWTCALVCTCNAHCLLQHGGLLNLASKQTCTSASCCHPRHISQNGGNQSVSCHRATPNPPVPCLLSKAPGHRPTQGMGGKHLADMLEGVLGCGFATAQLSVSSTDIHSPRLTPTSCLMPGVGGELAAAEHAGNRPGLHLCHCQAPAYIHSYTPHPP